VECAGRAKRRRRFGFRIALSGYREAKAVSLLRLATALQSLDTFACFWLNARNFPTIYLV
jgi:hypothetical protein